jgi:hypothetical protein
VLDKDLQFDLELGDSFVDPGLLTPGSWYLDVARFVKAKSEELAQNPNYAALVRSVTANLLC